MRYWVPVFAKSCSVSDLEVGILVATIPCQMPGMLGSVSGEVGYVLVLCD